MLQDFDIIEMYVGLCVSVCLFVDGMRTTGEFAIGMTSSCYGYCHGEVCRSVGPCIDKGNHTESLSHSLLTRNPIR